MMSSRRRLAMKGKQGWAKKVGADALDDEEDEDEDASGLDEEDEDGGIMSLEDEGDVVEKKAKGKKNKKSLTEVVSKPKSNKKALIEKVASAETESGESGVKRNSQGEIVEITSLEDDELTVEGK